MLKFFTQRDENVISVKTRYFQFMSINSSVLTITFVFFAHLLLFIIDDKETKKEKKTGSTK
jgi:hypothetical protein